jgi:uncharacterized repeat protein (TIGR04138 family)
VDPALMELIREDARYAYEAYEFVCDAVGYTQHRLGRHRDEREARDAMSSEAPHESHVSGEELVRGACQYATEQFGWMAAIVFKQWGIRVTDDIGEIVFNLISIEKLSKSERDDRHDFHALFDLHTLLNDDYEFTTAAYPARRTER